MALISVIVPVYKVEDYLDKCVESIVAQTYTNLEIILVDDGSPDRCGEMCDEWAKKDSRIRVIHKENGGLSDARNAGMDIASGEYIAFVDSDDWIHPCFIDSLRRVVKEHGAQIAACGVRFVYGDRDTAEEKEIASAVVYTAEQALETLIYGKGFRAVAWNKLYHRSLVENERFPVGKYHEDEYFSYKIIGKADKLAFVETEMYYYLQRSSGIMGSVSLKHLEALQAGAERLAYFKEHYPRLYNKDKFIFCVGCVWMYKTTLLSNDPAAKEWQKKIKDYRKAVPISFEEWLSCSLKDKLYIAGGRCCITLLCRLLMIKEKQA